MTEIRGLKAYIDDLRFQANEEREGGVVDLCNILLKVIHNFQHRGQAYIIKRYWRGKRPVRKK